MLFLTTSSTFESCQSFSPPKSRRIRPSQVISMEMDPVNATIARNHIELAGLSHVVTSTVQETQTQRSEKLKLLRTMFFTYLFFDCQCAVCGARLSWFLECE